MDDELIDGILGKVLLLSWVSDSENVHSLAIESTELGFDLI